MKQIDEAKYFCSLLGLAWQHGNTDYTHKPGQMMHVLADEYINVRPKYWELTSHRLFVPSRMTTGKIYASGSKCEVKRQTGCLELHQVMEFESLLQ